MSLGDNDNMCLCTKDGVIQELERKMEDQVQKTHQLEGVVSGLYDRLQDNHQESMEKLSGMDTLLRGTPDGKEPGIAHLVRTHDHAIVELNKSKFNWGPVIIAVIGLLGVVGAAYIQSR